MSREWTKDFKAYFPDEDETIIRYVPCTMHKSIDVAVESRNKAIPHANGRGSWRYTSYFVIEHGIDVKETRALKEAKEYAETLIRKG